MIEKSKLPSDTLILDSDNPIYFDVDETLIFWKTDQDPNDVVIKIVNPYQSFKYIEVVPHLRNIEMLKDNKGKGRSVIVWSAGGVFWAKNVVEALNIQSYVDLILPKPVMYADDTDMKDWGCQRIFLGKDYRPHPVHDSFKKEDK